MTKQVIIKQTMIEKGLTVDSLFTLVVKKGLEKELPYQSIRNWWLGRSNPRLERLKLLATMLDVAPSALVAA